VNPVLYAARLGVARGWIEFKQSLANRQDMSYTVVINAILLGVLVWQRGSTVDGMSLATLTLPGILGMTVATGGVLGVATMLAAEREDGTLLRAKATPHGMVGYLVARIVTNALVIALGIVIIFVPGLFLLDGLAATGAVGWLTLLAVLAVGLPATLPWGAIIGSLVKTPGASFGLTFLPISGLVAISGIFYPITAMPGWVQGVAQVFPIYWLGLGMRSALLPDAAAAAELGDSWRHLETFGVLGVWAAVGLLVAPTVLRRMARRESGSTVEARRQQALQRVS
jgi:ABC-2 type transport system permease protein